MDASPGRGMSARPLPPSRISAPRIRSGVSANGNYTKRRAIVTRRQHLGAVRAMPDLLPCPRREQLLALATGRLPAQSLQAIADHVEACRECETALADLS